MPNPWYPKAYIAHGAQSGYGNGRSRMRTVVCHFTVGRDSHPIGVRGYFHWLVRRNGQIMQYAECDAVTWHAGSWNQYGPGIEIEYLPGEDDEIFTNEARVATADLVQWLHNEWGFPLDYYDGPRIDPVWDGFIAHRSLAGGDHTDWWPREDWDRMVAPAPQIEDGNDMFIATGQTVYGVTLAVLASGGRTLKTFEGPIGAYGIPQSALDWKAEPGRDMVPFIFVDPDVLGQFATPWPPAGVSSANASAAAIAKAVNDDAARRLAG